MKKIALFVLAAAVTLVSVGPVSGQVLISEIMYNPDSYEGGIGKDAPPNQSEWVELYNAGDEAVSLAGFYLQDEDGKTDPLPKSASIAPGEAIVLIPGTQSVADFRKAWARSFRSSSSRAGRLATTLFRTLATARVRRTKYFRSAMPRTKWLMRSTTMTKATGPVTARTGHRSA